MTSLGVSTQLGFCVFVLNLTACVFSSYYRSNEPSHTCGSKWRWNCWHCHGNVQYHSCCFWWWNPWETLGFFLPKKWNLFVSYLLSNCHFCYLRVIYLIPFFFFALPCVPFYSGRLHPCLFQSNHFFPVILQFFHNFVFSFFRVPAAGFFNKDDVPDFLVRYNTGTGFPVYFYANVRHFVA